MVAVITSAVFSDYQLCGVSLVTGVNMRSPSDLRYHPYNTVRPCDSFTVGLLQVSVKFFYLTEHRCRCSWQNVNSNSYKH